MIRLRNKHVAIRLSDVRYKREAPPAQHDDDDWWKWEFTSVVGEVRRGWVRGPKSNCETVVKRVIRFYNANARNGMPLTFIYSRHKGDVRC